MSTDLLTCATGVTAGCLQIGNSCGSSTAIGILISLLHTKAKRLVKSEKRLNANDDSDDHDDGDRDDDGDHGDVCDHTHHGADC